MADNKKHGSLAAALAAFQADLPSVTKNAENPHFKSKFADLAEMSRVLLPALARQGLAFVSMPTLTDRGFVLAYSLLHESGEKVDGEYPLNGTGNDQQKGSSISYARRYALGAVTGAAADDDDGNAASQVKQVQPPSNWRKLVVDAPNQDALTAVYQQATQGGWAVPEVMQALTSRKTALQTEAQGAAADA